MEKIEIVGYSIAWPIEFEREASSIRAAIGDVVVEIHHIGSTAIPGCDAKPIIDMLAVVTSLEDLDVATPSLEALGYEALGEFGIPGRRYFRKGSAFEERTHQIHAFAEDSPEIERHLAFRDHLRSHPEAVAQYVELKRRLASAHPDDVEAYTEGKNEFIRGIEARALTETSDYWNPLVPELVVADVDASLRFYSAAGFHVRFRRKKPDFAYIELGEAQLMLIQQHDSSWNIEPLDRPLGRGVNFQIEVPSTSAVAERLTREGFELFQEPKEVWYRVSDSQQEGQIELLAQDPDGYLMRFAQVLGSREMS